MDEQNAPVVVVKPKHVWQMLPVLIILVLAIASGVSGYMYYQQRLVLDAKQKEIDDLKVSVHVAQTESAISDDMVQRLQSQIAQTNVQNDTTDYGYSSTTNVYAFNSDFYSNLVEERGQDLSSLDIVHYDIAMGRAYATTVHVGLFDHSIDSHDLPTEPYQRLANGIYQFTIVHDFSEAGYYSWWFVNPEIDKAISVGGGTQNDAFGGSGQHIVFSDDTSGDLMVHVSSDECENNQKETIDSLTWNGAVVYTFKPAITAHCTYSELGGGTASFFKAPPPQPSIDLQTIAFPLENGRTVLVKQIKDGVSVNLK